MDNFDTFNRQTERPFLAKLLILVGLTLLFLVVGSSIGLLFFSTITHTSFDAIQDILAHLPHSTTFWYGLMALQIFSTPLPFIASAFFYWKFIEKRSLEQLSFHTPYTPLLLVVLFLVIGFIPFDTLLIEWNKNMDLPLSLKSLEEWMKGNETDMEKMTSFIIDFTSIEQFSVAIFVVAILAGISEELLFRGILQNVAMRAWQNPHLAIWFSAFVFSFIHFQFYGFLPRMLLGGMFGYLYYWTKNLYVPIFAHFVNNGFSILMAYLFNVKIIKTDIDKIETVPLAAALISLGLTVYLLAWVYRNRGVKEHS